ncbi:MAG: Rpn family recombination-promoting nuclease/putative transposase, partial [Planctomycetaceae bacterium]|nr:Rpn family recombination-promoting nuclease/putative transposase [Planctomycetaceae bacterium]
ITLDEFKKKYQHDAFCKEKLKDVRTAQKFLRYFLDVKVQELLDLEQLQIDSDSLVDKHFKQAYLDIIYRIPLKNNGGTLVVFILIELKTNNQYWTIFQIAGYVLRLWEREWKAAKKAGCLRTFLFPMVIPIIFHYGKRRFTAPTELIKLVHTIAGLESYTLNMKALLFDTSALAQENFPQDLELNILFTVLQMVFSKNVTDRLMQIYRKLKPTLHLQESQQEWIDALNYAITSAKHFPPEEYVNVTKQIEQEGDIIMSTSLLDQLIAKGKTEGRIEGKAEGRTEGKAEGRTEGRAEGKAEGRIEGRAEGRTEGRAKGRTEGRVEGKAEMIIRILSRRLRLPSKLLQKKINSIQNSAKLDELADFALTCVSLEEFATALK